MVAHVHIHVMFLLLYYFEGSQSAVLRPCHDHIQRVHCNATDRVARISFFRLKNLLQVNSVQCERIKTEQVA